MLGLKGFCKEGKCHFYLHFIVQAKNMATSFFKGAEKYVFTICLEGEPGYFLTALMTITAYFPDYPCFRLGKPLELWKI